MSAPSYEASSTNFPNDRVIEAAESKPLNVALNGGKYVELARRLSAPALAEFMKDPSTQIEDFEETSRNIPGQYDPKHQSIGGTVPSGNGERERVSVLITTPGKLTRGLHKAISRITGSEPLGGTVYIENFEHRLK